MALWRTDTHWYRPIRLTDEARFVEDMRRGWVAVGALDPTYDDILRDYVVANMKAMLGAPSLYEHFSAPRVTLTGGPVVYPIRVT